MSRPIRLFISCFQGDEAWRERLVTVLAPLKRDLSLDIWHEGLIEPGAIPEAVIAQAVASAQVAILLASAKFIQFKEAQLEELVKRSQQGMEFFWIPISSALYEKTSLKDIPPAWEKPLALIGDPALQEEALVAIIRKVERALIRAEEGGEAINLADSASGALSNRRPAEVKEEIRVEIETAPGDTDRLLVALIDRQYQETPLQERSRSAVGPTLFVVPGPEPQDPALFIRRIKAHTCNVLLQELKKRNRFLIHADVPWPSFPSTANSKEAIDSRLKSIITEVQVRAQLSVDSPYGEPPDAFAPRVFKAVRDTNPATLHVFVLQLVNAEPGPGESQCFARLVGMWEKFCAEHAPSNIMIVFVVNASRAAFDASYGAALAGFQHATVIEEMPNIVYNDINTWLQDNRLSTCFNIDEIKKQARTVGKLNANDGIPMLELAEQAVRWLGDHRIKR